MKFDDDWKQSTELDAYSIDENEYRYDRVATCTIVCTDIVGGVQLFEQLPFERFQALLQDYLTLVRQVFGEAQEYNTLRDDVFVSFEGKDPEAIQKSLAFVELLRKSPLSYQCSVGISCGDVAVLTKGKAIEHQGPPIAMAKGLAKISGAGGVFVDETALSLVEQAGHKVYEVQQIVLPHVGRPIRVAEVVGQERVGVKQRFRARLEAPRVRV